MLSRGVWIGLDHGSARTEPNGRLRLRAPHARTAAVLWPLAGRAQGGAGCPARAGRSGASLRPPRPCPRLRCGAALVAMRLRARGGARRSGSRRVFRAVWWGVLWPVPSLSFRPALSSCRVGLFRSRRRGGVGSSGLPWPLGLAGGGCGPRRGRSRRQWSWSAFPRLPPRRPSLALGRAGWGRFGIRVKSCHFRRRSRLQ